MSVGAPLVLTSNESACVDTARNYAITAGANKAIIMGGQDSVRTPESAKEIVN